MEPHKNLTSLATFIYNNATMSSYDSHTVYVGGLSYDATEDDVRDHFSQCGSVLSVRMPTFPDSGRSKGLAFVEFDGQAGVDAALQLADTNFMGRTIRVDVARGKGNSGDRPSRGRREFSPDRSSNRRQFGSPTRRDPSEPSETVFVGNLAWSATEDDLRSHFESCGDIVDVRLPEDRYSGRKKGFGYVTFDSVEAAQKALEMNGSEIAGRQVRLDFSASKRNQRS